MRYWLTDLVERFDPHRHVLRQAVRTAVAALLGLIAFMACVTSMTRLIGLLLAAFFWPRLVWVRRNGR